MFEYLWLTPLIIALLLVVSAFFSGTETALTAASRARLHKMAQGGDKRAILVRRLQNSRQRLISVLLMANNVVNVFASALATGFLIYLFGDKGVAMATVIMTLLILLFAEVAPKLYAIENPVAAAKKAAPTAALLMRLLSPPAQAVEKVAVLLIKPFLRQYRHDQASEEELQGAIDIHGRSGGGAADERKMLRGILDLDDANVGKIMIHKKEVFSLSASLNVGEAVALVADCGFTRIPLWRGDKENIVAILHSKMLLNAAADSVAVRRLAVEPWFIPETTSLLAQLQAFRAKRSHFAMVVDEYGAWQGIVTLEDILEEIVGDIADEFDRLKSEPRLTEDGSVTVAGNYSLRDLNRRFDWELPDEEAATVGGFIAQESRTIPSKSRIFSFYGFGFEILGGNRRTVTMVKISPP